MGSSASKTTTKGNPICEDCNKRVETTPSLDECGDLYDAVDSSMKQHLGRVAPCANEWEAFRKCHLRQKNKEST